MEACGTAQTSSACELLRINADSFCETVQASQVLDWAAGEYGRYFHRRFTCAYPPLAMHVPFMDYCDLVVPIPAMMQEVTGMVPALVNRGTLGRYLDSMVVTQCIPHLLPRLLSMT